MDSNAFTPEAEQELRETLKRCSPETLEAAIRFRKSADKTAVPVIVLGIVERFMDPELRPKLSNGGDDMKFSEDLGIDSLTMVEMVMMIEDTLKLPVDNNDLRDLRTVGDVKKFLQSKLA